MTKQQNIIWTVIGVIVLIIAGMLIFGGSDSSDTQTKTDGQNASSTDMTASSTVSKPVTKPASSISASTKKPATMVTQADVLGASYTLSAVINGTSSAPKTVTFPVAAATTDKLSGIVTIDDEMFYIAGFEFTDATESVAQVNIIGGYGAAWNDERTFFVTKTNGKVVAREVPQQ